MLGISNELNKYRFILWRGEFLIDLKYLFLGGAVLFNIPYFQFLFFKHCQIFEHFHNYFENSNIRTYLSTLQIEN